MYQTDASKVTINTDEVIYIFLDPKYPINKDGVNQNGEGQNQTNVQVTFKKRWDGYNQNSGSVYSGSDGDIHHDENIRVQLQIWDETDKTWVKYSNEYIEAKGEDYTFKFNFEYPYNGKNYFIPTAALPEILVGEKPNNCYMVGNEAYTTPDGKYIDIDKVEAYLAENVDENYSVGRNYRFKIQLEDDKYWNDIVLTPEGANHPQHFPNGYYYDWDGLPVGQYRVIETQVFRDIDGDDIYTEGVDVDTTDDYYYMIFPPARRYDGICHAQNFTKAMDLTVNKEWQIGGTRIPDDQLKGVNKLFDSKVNYDIYRATVNGEPTEDNGKYKVDGTELELVEENKVVSQGTASKHENLPSTDPNGDKYYYYVRERINDNFVLINEHDDYGFVKIGVGNTFGVSYEDGNFRDVILKNKPKMTIDVSKKWYEIESLIPSFAEFSKENDQYSHSYGSNGEIDDSNITARIDTLFDDNDKTYCGVEANDYFILDFGKKYSFTEIKYRPRYRGKDGGWGNRTEGATLYGSNDNNEWELISTFKKSVEGEYSTAEIPDNCSYQYLRYNAKTVGNNLASDIGDLQIFGIPTDGKPTTETREVTFALLSSTTPPTDNPQITYNNNDNKYYVGGNEAISADVFTTANLKSSIDVAGFKNNGTSFEKLYYYVYEIGGGSYNLADYNISIPSNGVCWIPDKLDTDYGITVNNISNSMPDTLIINTKWLTKEQDHGNINIIVKNSSDKIVSNTDVGNNTTYTVNVGEGYTIEAKSSSGKKYYIDKKLDSTNNVCEIKIRDNLIDVTVEKKWETLYGEAPTDGRTIEIELLRCTASNNNDIDNWYDLGSADLSANEIKEVRVVTDDNGNPMKGTITDNGSVTFKVPYLDENGNRYLYTARETNVTLGGKNPEIYYNMGQVPKTNSGNIVIVNSLKRGNLQIKKQWHTDTPNSYDDLAVKIEILADGKLLNIDGVENPIVLDKNNGWTSPVIEVPMYDGSGSDNKVSYTIREIAVTGANADVFNLKEDSPYEFNYGDGTAQDISSHNPTVGESILTLTANNIAVGYKLPSTGGIGTTWFYIIGGSLFGISTVYLVSKRRLSKKSYDTLS